MKYFTSDLHVNHLNVINYCNRPYKDCEEMNQAIVNSINNRVWRPDDELYVLGDFSLNPKWVEWALPQLTCKNIHLIVGNHDSCFEKKLGAKPEKTQKMKKRYYNAGFKTIKDIDNITISKPRDGILGKLGSKKSYNVQLSHFPFKPNGDGKNVDLRYMNQRVEDKGQILLHGHSHCMYVKNGRMIDVGFDHKFEPWSEEEIVDLIENKEDYIPSRITEYYASRKEELIKKDDY